MALVLVFQYSILAQDASPEPDATYEPITVTLDNKPLFDITTDSGSFSAAERAKAIRKRLVKIAEDPEIPVESIRTEVRGGEVLIIAGDKEKQSIAFLSPKDAAAQKTQPKLLADRYVQTIRESVTDYRQSRSIQNVL
ncbi:MAG: hypothetical protein C4288_19825 [Leptolyngbya sp. ERB_1_1]